MGVHVIKFGGTSLISPEQRERAARQIKDSRDYGHAPVIIVSAIGRRGAPYATDTLLNLAYTVSSEIAPREHALLASCGETVATVLMSATLLRAGLAAVALTGAQAGIRTTSSYVSAAIEAIDPQPLMRWIERGYIPVVAGFQGANAANELTILERGGSDISGAAVASALSAQHLSIVTDVPGVMTADPTLVADAVLIPRLSFSQAHTLARYGAKVIHPEAVRWAMEAQIATRIGLLDDWQGGTQIAAYNHGPQDHPIGLAVSADDAAQRATIALVGQQPAAAERVCSAARQIVRAHDIPLLSATSNADAAVLTVPLADMPQVVRSIHARYAPLWRAAAQPASTGDPTHPRPIRPDRHRAERLEGACGPAENTPPSQVAIVEA